MLLQEDSWNLPLDVPFRIDDDDWPPVGMRSPDRHPGSGALELRTLWSSYDEIRRFDDVDVALEIEPWCNGESEEGLAVRTQTIIVRRMDDRADPPALDDIMELRISTDTVAMMHLLRLEGIDERSQRLLLQRSHTLPRPRESDDHHPEQSSPSIVRDILYSMVLREQYSGV